MSIRPVFRCQVWKMGPYPRPLPAPGNARAAHMSRMGGSGFAV